MDTSEENELSRRTAPHIAELATLAAELEASGYIVKRQDPIRLVIRHPYPPDYPLAAKVADFLLPFLREGRRSEAIWAHAFGFCVKSNNGEAPTYHELEEIYDLKRLRSTFLPSGKQAGGPSLIGVGAKY